MHARIVPTLAAMCLTSAGLLSAAEFAPTLTIPVGEPAAQNVSGDGVLHIPIQPIFEGQLWDFDDQYQAWVQIAGIGITAAGGGTWEYFDGSSTFTIPAPAGGEAVLLDLATWDASAELVFTPSPYSVADGTLVFRAWDGSNGFATLDTADDATLFGGDTAYSSEERTLTVNVSANQQAVLSTTALTRTIRDLTTRNIPVADLLSEAGASDPDGYPLGLAITALDATGTVWGWNDGVASGTLAAGLILGPGAVITCQPNASSPALSFVAHDSSDGRGSGDAASPDVASEISNWSGPGDPPFSDLANSATLTVAVANTPPVVVGDTSVVVVRGGPDQTVALTASDLDGDTVLWSAVADYSGISTPASPIGNPVDIVITPPALGTGYASGYIDVTADDQHGGTVLHAIAVTIHDAPVIADDLGSDILAPVVLPAFDGGSSTSLDLTVNDPDSADWTWSYSTNGDENLAVDFTTVYGSPVTVGITSSHLNATSATVTLWATDTDGNDSAPVDIQLTINQPPNAAPVFDVLPAELAVAEQPFTSLLLASDPDSDPVTLAYAVSAYVGGAPVSSPNWVHISKSGGRATLTMTPPADASWVEVQWTAQDPTHSTVHIQHISIDTAYAQVVTTPVLPESTPGNPLYGAIAPGSDNGFASLRQTLAPFSAEVARGWWWSTPGIGYRDVMASLPGNGASAGAFVANTDSGRQLSLSFSTRPFPAPFAIDLPAAGASSASGWTFFGVPPIYLDGESNFVTAHDWGYDFRLEEADGTPFTDGADVAAALSPLAEATFSDTQPFAYDATGTPAFARTGYLDTGTGYWIRNRLTRPLRLVRVGYGAQHTLGSLNYPGGQVAQLLRAAPQATVDESPPAPPAGGSTADSAAAAGGSCGAGGLAGLLAAALGMIGLRRGRRN